MLVCELSVPQHNHAEGRRNRAAPRIRRYMDRITAALQVVEEQSADGAPVTLLAHSAGGWLSRVFLLEVGATPWLQPCSCWLWRWHQHSRCHVVVRAFVSSARFH
jgi:triacylglycerol esterase/lipase EstA (alpha/beta hydrolase family)